MAFLAAICVTIATIASVSAGYLGLGYGGLGYGGLGYGGLGYGGLGYGGLGYGYGLGYGGYGLGYGGYGLGYGGLGYGGLGYGGGIQETHRLWLRRLLWITLDVFIPYPRHVPNKSQFLLRVLFYCW
ncbi:hypothetical protein MRX96_041899 [Rhipicephalus microplus]